MLVSHLCCPSWCVALFTCLFGAPLWRKQWHSEQIMPASSGLAFWAGLVVPWCCMALLEPELVVVAGRERVQRQGLPWASCLNSWWNYVVSLYLPSVSSRLFGASLIAQKQVSIFMRITKGVFPVSGFFALPSRTLLLLTNFQTSQVMQVLNGWL